VREEDNERRKEKEGQGRLEEKIGKEEYRGRCESRRKRGSD
jgi:hypothetical protein